MSWRAGATLFKDIWPFVQTRISEEKFRAEFTKGLLELFMECDVDGTELRHVDAEVDKALDELGVDEG